MTLVKICGVRTVEQALCAAGAGADLVGLVFYGASHRSVSVAEAAAISRALRDAGGHTLAVGLFVNEPAEYINQVSDAAILDLVQLSGDEPVDLLSRIERPLLRTVRIAASGDVRALQEGMRRDREAVANRPVGPLDRSLAFLLDAHVEGAFGGTGARANWSLARELARVFPLVLAGGLTPETVAGAVRAVRPLGVDVSSGVETNRVKDLAKIRQFVEAVRAADDQLAGVPDSATEVAVTP